MKTHSSTIPGNGRLEIDERCSPVKGRPEIWPARHISLQFKIVDSATDVQKWLCDSYGQKQVLPTGERCTQYLFGIIMRSGWFVLPKKSQRCPNSLLLVSKWSHKDNLYQNCYVCSAQTLAHKPALRRRDPQKYTYSYHGNKCLKGNSRSVTKSDSRGPGKSQRAIKDTW